MTGSFAAAIARPEPPAPTIADDAVVDPRTGEIIDVQTIDHPDLVAAFLALKDYEQHVKMWRTAVEDELVARHGDRRGAQVIGDWEVDVDRGSKRVWDETEVELVLTDLVERDLLDVKATSGLVDFVPKVDGAGLARLLARLQGDALAELSRCFTWESRGRARAKVTPVVALEP